MANLWQKFTQGGWNSRAYELGTTALAVAVPFILSHAFTGTDPISEVIKLWL